MHARGIVHKSISSNKGMILPEVPQQIKTIDGKYFDDRGAVFVFADKIAFYTAAENDSEPTTLIITNHRIAETYKKNLRLYVG